MLIFPPDHRWKLAALCEIFAGTSSTRRTSRLKWPHRFCWRRWPTCHTPTSLSASAWLTRLTYPFGAISAGWCALLVSLCVFGVVGGLFPWLQCRSKRSGQSGRSCTWGTCWRRATSRASGYAHICNVCMHLTLRKATGISPLNTNPDDLIVRKVRDSFCHFLSPPHVGNVLVFLISSRLDESGREQRAHRRHRWIRGLGSQVCVSARWPFKW